jgi:hypothetical protein
MPFIWKDLDSSPLTLSLFDSHNKLGDNLSPVFSTGEFQNLKFLRVLDLSYNGLLGIADTLIKGCESLKVSVYWLPGNLR